MEAKNSRSPTVNQFATIMEDNQQVAFMILQGYKVIPWRDTDDPQHILFEIVCSPEEADAEMAKYFSNVTVGITDYINCLKSVKSQMYAMKKNIKKN